MNNTPDILDVQFFQKQLLYNIHILESTADLG